MEIKGMTNRGYKRRENEDYFLIRNDEYHYAIVCDGMGGHKGGKTASTLAVKTMAEHVDELINGEEELSEKFIARAIRDVNKKVYKTAAEDVDLFGMGTTLSMMVFCSDRILVGHVGDSRIYRLRDDELLQVTDDDSFVNMLVKGGEITKEEAKTHPKRSLITKAVGTSKEIEPTVMTLEIVENDLYLICSDGLSSMIEDEDIGKVLIDETRNKEEKNEKLIALALEAGGHDNITCVLAQL